MSDEVPVSTSVPIDLHPSRFDNRLNPETDPAIGGHIRAVQQAFADAYSRLSRVPSEVTQIRDNKDWSLSKKQQLTDSARAAANAEARETLTKLTDRVDRMVVEYEGRLAAAAGVTDEPSPTDAEIRAHVKSLPEIKRLEFVRTLAQKGDRTSVNAVLRGARFLSGFDTVSDADFASLKSEWLGLLAPDAAKALAKVQRLRDEVRAGIGMVG